MLCKKLDSLFQVLADIGVGVYFWAWDRKTTNR